MATHVDTDTLAILGRASTNGHVLHLTDGLDRKAYARVAKVIELAGGRWDKKAKAHLFDEMTAEDALEQVLLTGQIVDERQELGAFYTPPHIAAQVIATADLKAGMAVLEPSAGRGALAAPAFLLGCFVDCVEIDPKSVKILCSIAFRHVVPGDFLAMRPKPAYDSVVMNPPFARQQDVAHVRHAARFLKPGGRLVAITSAGVLFRTDRRTELLKRLVAAGDGTMAALPDDSFASAGTKVRTAMVAFTATPALLALLAEG